MIIPALLARQKQRGGYLTPSDMRAVAEEQAVPLHRVQSLISFFPHFRTSPPPKVEVHVCRDMSCHLRGSVPMTERLEHWAEHKFGSDVEVCGVSCLGRCDRAAAAVINEELYVNRDEEELKQIIQSYVDEQPISPDTDYQWVAQKNYAWDIDVYENESPNYESVRNYLSSPNPKDVIKALETAGLLGMGGAGGRAFKKWAEVMEAEGTDKFVVCNADESEPGTFKDRDIMLMTPHLIVEGITLAGLVVGATRGWVYIRHEYPEQIASVDAEIQRARQLGVLGQNMCDSGKKFELSVFVSPGNYICGEQTALIEAMEDNRAEPRIRPPELVTNGYQNQPTLLNNVETFAWVPAIVLRSAGQWYSEQGRKTGPWVAGQSKLMNGKRFFSISGDVARPGAYEVPTGIPLGELIDNFCGGMAPGKQLVAVALSGPSGGLVPAKIPVKLLSRKFVEDCVPPGTIEFDIRELPLDINISRVIGLMIGAGIVVYGTGANVIAEALACSRFFARESCGKCVPCRIGSQKITEMGEQLLRGDVSSKQLPILRSTALELSQVMTATSICGLGQVASNPVRSILNYFPELVEGAAGFSEDRNPE
jgi:formate dehydrogenase beta subunit